MLIMFFLFLFLSKKSQKIVFLYTFIVKAMKIKYLQAKKGIQIIYGYTDCKNVKE